MNTLKGVVISIRIPGLIAATVALSLVAGTNATEVRMEAYRGEPFGIGRATVTLTPDAANMSPGDDRISIEDIDGRILYPVIGKQGRPVRRIVRSFLNIDLPSRLTFYFMFRGDELLDLTLYTPEARQVTIRPRDDARKYQDLVRDWWEATSDRFQQVFQQADYPVVVENFITSTWARRLDRDMPRQSRYLLREFRWGDPWVSQLAANEGYRTELERDLLLGRLGAGESATLTINDLATRRVTTPVDDALELPPPPAALPTSVEPLAAHVPNECFYLRFGNFSNYLWFRDFMRHWQGDLGNMLVLQSVDHDNSARFQQQIAVGESKLSRIMGPAVIRDVAIIGLDMYLRDGAAMGILFQANNSALLKNNLSSQRQDSMGRHPEATEETIKVAGRDVSYISSPGGQLRSFYAIDGDFHLVANSLRLVERFFDAGRGKRSLAASAEFQEAREAMTLEREDTIFLYVSAAFLDNLAGPHYRIELDRRLRSIGEMRALTLARLAAKAEGHRARTIDDLIAADLLPLSFGERADGSKIVSTESGLRDSLRGIAGRMVPIPDMPIERITESEARRLVEFQQGLRASVGEFSPIVVALKRDSSPVNEDWDRIIADIRIAPYSQMPIARWPNMLGPAGSIQLAPIAGDVASLELIVDALGQPVHLFGGLRDFRSPLAVREGQVQPTVPIAEFIRAYIGAWPRPHLLDRFLGRADGPLDPDGIARTGGLFDLWLRRADDFFLFSFKRDVLLEVGPQLVMVDAESSAQIRLRIDDLSNKQVADAVTAYGYMRSRNTSASASRFMNSLTSHLHVPPEEVRPLAEALVDGKFNCPLGGKYELVSPTAAGAWANVPANSPNGFEPLPAPNDGVVAPTTKRRLMWTSTATPPENRFLLTVIPTDYTMPFMTWFRGLSTEVARLNDELTLHAELDMVHLKVGPPEDPETKEGGLKLPNLGELFGGFGRKQDDQVKPASTDDKPAEQRN